MLSGVFHLVQFDSGASIEGDESEEWTMDEDSEYDLSGVCACIVPHYVGTLSVV